MLILQPHIFKKFKDLEFGFSTRIGDNETGPYCFNLSLSVGDDKERVLKNRNKFFNALGLSFESAVIQKQVHGDKINYVTKPGNAGESDALVTDKPGLTLCISTADCTPIFIYDQKIKIIAAVHSGWRGTQKRITEKTLIRLISEYHCAPEDMYVYIGPSINQANYQVGNEVADFFEDKYLLKDGNKFRLDISSANYGMIIGQGIPSCNIQKSPLCSYEYTEVFHSYRRDGKLSGRTLGIIAMK